MKQAFYIVACGAIALLGLSSCTSEPNTAPGASSAAPDTAVAPKAQAAIKAAGSSSAIEILRILKTHYAATPNTAPINLLEPGQSENIITGVKQGLVDLGGISRTLKPEEKDGSLEFREIAHDALVVATHSSVTGVKDLTTENLKAIYSGTITNWKQLGGPDAEIVVLDRPEDESAKRLLRQHYLGPDLQNAPKAVVLRKEGELIQTLQSTPYSIGAFSLAYAIVHQLPVHRLSLNQIEPTPANVKNGQYAMVRTIGFIWNKQASAETHALIQYVVSPAGTQVLEQAGFAPSQPATASNPQ